MQSNPLWPANLRFPKLTENIHADIIIVGAGIAGISAAYHLDKAGYKVVVLESDEIGNAATGASSGILFYGSGTDFIPATKIFGNEKATLLWKETSLAIDEMVSLAEKYKLDCELRKCGAIMVAKTQEEKEILKEESDRLAEIGIKSKMLTGEDIKEFYTPNSFAAGLAFDSCAQICPARFISGLAKALKIDVYENSAVVNWEEREDDIVVNTKDAKLTCSKLIFATNRQPYFRLNEHFSSESSVILAGSKTEDIEKIWPKEKIIWTMEEKYDLIYPKQGRMILELYTLTGHKEKEAYYYPNANFKAEKTWGDSWAKTADWMPIVGNVSRNIFAAVAMGDQGIIIGWLSGKNMVDAIAGKPNWFLQAASPKRFSTI